MIRSTGKRLSTLRIPLVLGLGCALQPEGRAGDLPIHESFELFAPDASAGDAFGSAVAADLERVVVGAIGDDDMGGASGSVYVFLRSAGTLVLEAKLTAPDGGQGDRFGTSVAIDGGRIVVGAMGDQGAGPETGSVYVFTRSGSVWSYETKLLANPPVADAQFGNAVALKGERLIAAAHREPVVGADSGAVYVFAHDASGWHEEAKISPADATTFDEFGFSLALAGERLLIGSFHDDDLGSSSGSAYVYLRSAGVWSLESKLVQDDGIAWDELGHAVGFDGEHAILGAPGAGGSSGAAYAYRRTGSQWVQVEKLVASEGPAHGFFGKRLAMTGRWAAIATPRDDSAAANAGSVHLYERCGEHWLARAELLASDAVASAMLGDAAALAVDGEALFAGAPGDDEIAGNAGSLYVLQQTSLPYTSICAGDGSATACPCGNSSDSGSGEGCRHSLGFGARMVPLGSASIAEDDFRLHLCQLPPRRLSMLIAGLSTVSGGSGAPFGDGLLCVAGGRAIIGLATADSAGEAHYGPGLALSQGFGAGDQRFFQARFRDPLGSPCGTAFNTTPAVGVTFVP